MKTSGGTNRNQTPSVVKKLICHSASFQLHLWEVKNIPSTSTQYQLGDLMPVTELSTLLTLFIDVCDIWYVKIGTGCSLQQKWVTGETNSQQSELLIKRKSENSCDNSTNRSALNPRGWFCAWVVRNSTAFSHLCVCIILSGVRTWVENKTY